MKRTFANEDSRKYKLFGSWVEFLRKIHAQFETEAFDEIYEGLAYVSDLSKNRIGFHLDDGRKLRHVPITPEISVHSARIDTLYLVLGRQKDKWWPLDVIMIGSIVDFESGHFHTTVNPLLVEQSVVQ